MSLSWIGLKEPSLKKTASGLTQLQHIFIQESFKSQLITLLGGLSKVQFNLVWTKDLGGGILALQFSYHKKVDNTQSFLKGLALLERRNARIWDLQDVEFYDQNIVFEKGITIDLSKPSTLLITDPKTENE